MEPNNNKLKQIAKWVVKGMLIGRKRNESGINASKRVFPSIEKFLKDNEGSVLSVAELEKKGLTQKQIAFLSNPDTGPILAARKDKYVVRSTIGQCVRLRHHIDNWPLAREIALECDRVGAHVFWTSANSEFYRQSIKESSMESLEDFPELSRAILNSVDVTIYLEDEDEPDWKRGISAEKLSAGQQNNQRAHEILDSRKVRWLVLGWPFEKTAKEFGLTQNQFSNMLFDSLAESFSQRTKNTVMYYVKQFTNANKVHITHKDGTDFTLSVKGRPVLKDLGYLTNESIEKDGDVGLNLPSGEAFISPLETSANGIIKFPHVNVYGHGFTSGLTLKFKNGRVEEFWANKGVKYLQNYLLENTPSTRIIGELGIGANQKAKWSGYLLTDEKIYGTIHIAIGNNTGSYHGKNKASGHLDMVKPMKDGLMTIDGRKVMVKGLPYL